MLCIVTLLRTLEEYYNAAPRPLATVGGGRHSPRGAATELTGIAVLPRARRRGVGAALTATLVTDARAGGIETTLLSAQDDTVARVFERIGFHRVGTACVAEPADG